VYTEKYTLLSGISSPNKENINNFAH